MRPIVCVIVGLVFALLSASIGYLSTGGGFSGAFRDAILGPEGSAADRLYYVVLVVLGPLSGLAAISGESAGWQAAVLLRFGGTGRLVLRSARTQLRRSVSVALTAMVAVVAGIMVRSGVPEPRDWVPVVVEAMILIPLGVLIGVSLEIAYRARSRHIDAVIALGVVVVLAQIPAAWNPVTFAAGGTLTDGPDAGIRVAALVVLALAAMTAAPSVLIRQITRTRRPHDPI